MKFTKILFLLFAITNGLCISGCISAWMTGATGEKVYFSKGTPRAEVVNSLGEPVEKRDKVSNALFHRLHTSPELISYLEIYEFKGKLNSVDEGGGQATVNALTLGTGEVIMIPLTTLDIIRRSFGSHRIFVFYDSSDKVVQILIDPKETQPPQDR